MRAADPAPAALEQRTALRYTMPGMTATGSYIAHHIKLVGRPDQLFTGDALNLIHSTPRGYPRASLQALVAAFVASKNLVDEPALSRR
jgi:type II secretory pathway predicted ATPase ExeA